MKILLIACGLFLSLLALVVLVCLIIAEEISLMDGE